MTRPIPKDERWEDPIVAEVRKAREKIFAAAGFDLDELARQLNERQQKEGRGVVTRAARRAASGTTTSAAKPNKRIQRTRKKDARR